MSTLATDRAHAREEGFAAYGAGKPITSNPYLMTSHARNGWQRSCAWIAGWIAAQLEANRHAAT